MIPSPKLGEGQGEVSPFLDVAIEAAQAAGEVLRQEYQKNHTGQRKADNTEVSDTDLAAEKVIIETIQKNFPDHAIFSEEAGMQKTNSEYLWIIDPLDGSTNFLKHLGHFCTIVSVVKSNQPLAHAIYIPLTDELFAVETSGSAQSNDQTITPSTIDNLKHSLIAIGRSSLNTTRHAQIYATLTPYIRSNRLMGSTAIQACYVGSGRFEALVCGDCKLYDILAAAMIAQAAGAKVTDFSGNPWQPNFSDPTSASDVLISNPHIHADLVAALKNL